MCVQVLLTGDGGTTKLDSIKVQVVAAFVGMGLTTRSAAAHEKDLTLPCLLANNTRISGGNVVCKLLIASAGHTLYPQAPFSADKRYRAAQIDAWLDFSTIKLQSQEVRT